MEPVKININSLRFHLATTYGGWDHVYENNICAFVRDLFLGAFIAGLISIFTGFALGCVADFFMSVYFDVVPTGTAIVGAVIFAMGLVVGVVLLLRLVSKLLVRGIIRLIEKIPGRKQRGSHLREVFKAWSDNVCRQTELTYIEKDK